MHLQQVINKALSSRCMSMCTRNRENVASGCCLWCFRAFRMNIGQESDARTHFGTFRTELGRDIFWERQSCLFLLSFLLSLSLSFPLCHPIPNISTVHSPLFSFSISPLSHYQLPMSPPHLNADGGLNQRNQEDLVLSKALHGYSWDEANHQNSFISKLHKKD